MNAFKKKELRVVFGAGGDRDRSKRPLMGEVAAQFAKKLYVTSDNPRHEDPDAIIEDICKGIAPEIPLHITPNRKEAIKTALQEQQAGEIVLILGKGDETYQMIYDAKLPFDDREVVRSLLDVEKS